LGNAKERIESSRIDEFKFKRGVVRLRRVEMNGWIDWNEWMN